jgi:hypothetical protein
VCTETACSNCGVGNKCSLSIYNPFPSLVISDSDVPSKIFISVLLRGHGEYAVEGGVTYGDKDEGVTSPFGPLKSEEGSVCIPLNSLLELGLCVALDTDVTDDSGISQFLSMAWGSGSGALKLTMRVPDPDPHSYVITDCGDDG